MATSIPNNEVGDEGDYDPVRSFDKSSRDFAESGQVEPAARETVPADAAEADEMKRVEDAGKSSRADAVVPADPSRARRAT